MIGQTTDTLSMNVRLAADGIVVVSQSYANGWRAYVDDKPANLFLTDGILQGVPVAAGAHKIELKYEPRSLTFGLWITGASGALLAGVWIYAFADRKRGADRL